jgi:ATPase subunit of ABC transporter with duplicated ATPase domains
MVAIITSTRHYALVIGEHGVGKTSLVSLALNKLGDTSGIVYVDVPIRTATYAQSARSMRKALGYTVDPVIDFQGSPSDFFQVGVKAN